LAFRAIVPTPKQIARYCFRATPAQQPIYSVDVTVNGVTKKVSVMARDEYDKEGNQLTVGNPEWYGLLALISFSHNAGDLTTALENAEHLARISPDDRDLANLIEKLRRELKGP
jgi:hypothetical protein